VGVKKNINIVMSSLIVLYILIVIIFGWKLMVVGQYQLSPALQIKMSFVYVIFPLSGVLMLLNKRKKKRNIVKCLFYFYPF
jgi:TRAP-type C4-dicarboxylate transport system permease small subunit